MDHLLFFRPTHRTLEWHRITIYDIVWLPNSSMDFQQVLYLLFLYVSFTFPSRFQKMCTNSHIFPNRILPLHCTCTVEAGDTEEALSWLPQRDESGIELNSRKWGRICVFKSWQLRFDAGTVNAWLMTSSTLYRLSYVRKYHTCCCPCVSCGSTCSLCWCPCLLSVTPWGTTNIY